MFNFRAFSKPAEPRDKRISEEKLRMASKYVSGRFSRALERLAER